MKNLPALSYNIRRYSFLLGRLGNQPRRTLSRCSKSSLMLQNDEKANTPSKVDSSVLATISEATTPTMPSNKNTHQTRTPHQYSVLITMG